MRSTASAASPDVGPHPRRATGSGPWRHPWRCGRLSGAGARRWAAAAGSRAVGRRWAWAVRGSRPPGLRAADCPAAAGLASAARQDVRDAPRGLPTAPAARRDRAPWAGCGRGVGRAGGSWAAEVRHRVVPAAHRPTRRALKGRRARRCRGLLEPSMIRAWSGRFGRVTWLNGPVPMVLSRVRERRRPRGASRGPATGGRCRAVWRVPVFGRVGPPRCHVCRVADRSVRVVWARPAAHRRAVSGHRPAPLTRWCVARGGGAARCAGRRCRSGARARGASAPAAPNTRRAGRQPRGVPAR